jgi:DNA (cytosine-5)-methyltransferase 1
MISAISLFSGMGGDTLGINNAGGKVIAFNEFDKHATSCHELNFPDTELIYDDSHKKDKDKTNISLIRDEIFEKYTGKVDLIFAGHPCFVAGTKVLTFNGYKNIEDVEISDKLLTHSGKFQNIVNLQNKIYNGKMYSFRIKYHPEEIHCTQEHPYYVRKRIKTWNCERNTYDITYNEPEWKHAKDITKDDLFGMVINEKAVVPNFTYYKPINKYCKKQLYVELNKPEYWFFMGYFLGDGWVQNTTKSDGRCRNTIFFAINNKDEEDIVDKIRLVLPIKDKKCNSGKCKKFGCSDYVWHKLLQQFGKYAHNKVIPEWVQDAPNEYIEQFIEGYRRADGCVKNNGSISFTTTSYNIAFGLQRLYLKLGFIFSVQKTNRPKYCYILGRKVNQCDTYTISGFDRPKAHVNSSFIDNNYVWFTSTRISYSTYTEKVYNFEVENDNSYIVENTIVHNCQGFSQGGKKLPDDPRNTLFREFARSAKLIKPKFIIGENVDGLLSRKTATGEKYIDVIVSEFNNIGYNVYYQVCHAVQYGVPQLRKRLVYVGIRQDIDVGVESVEGNDDNSQSGFHFPEPLNDRKTNLPNLKKIVTYNMTGAIKIDPEDFDMTSIPGECILRNMEDDSNEDSDNIHPYLRLKAKTRGQTYNGKTFDNTLSFAKRESPIHAEVIDIRAPSKTIICTYDHQPRLFVPIQNKNGYFLRPLLPDELKQIQGFPANFKLNGSVKEQIKQIGNAAPPPLVYQIVKQLIAYCGGH